MGILKIITKPDADAKYLENAIHYIIYGHSIVSGGFNICPEYALEQMQSVKESGRQGTGWCGCRNKSEAL